MWFQDVVLIPKLCKPILCSIGENVLKIALSHGQQVKSLVVPFHCQRLKWSISKSQKSLERNFDKNHMGISNGRVSSLGFVLILWDLIHGIKNRQLTLTKTDLPFTSQFHHDIAHQVRRLIAPMTAHTFSKAEPHHPSRATSSARDI